MNPLYRLFWIILRIYLKLFCRLKIIGSENIPKTGGIIVASNHISAADPPFVGSCINRPMFFMAKKELFKNFFFGRLITAVNAFPVNRGIFDREALQKSEEVLTKGYGLIMFPEGTRSKTGELGEVKPGIGLLSRKAVVPIIPAYIQNSNGFWKLIFKGKRITVQFGSAIDAQWIRSIPDTKDGYRNIADEVINRIRVLKDATER